MDSPHDLEGLAVALERNGLIEDLYLAAAYLEKGYGTTLTPFQQEQLRLVVWHLAQLFASCVGY